MHYLYVFSFFLVFSLSYAYVYDYILASNEVLEIDLFKTYEISNITNISSNFTKNSINISERTISLSKEVSSFICSKLYSSSFEVFFLLFCNKTMVMYSNTFEKIFEYILPIDDIDINMENNENISRNMIKSVEMIDLMRPEYYLYHSCILINFIYFNKTHHILLLNYSQYEFSIKYANMLIADKGILCEREKFVINHNFLIKYCISMKFTEIYQFNISAENLTLLNTMEFDEEIMEIQAYPCNENYDCTEETKFLIVFTSKIKRFLIESTNMLTEEMNYNISLGDSAKIQNIYYFHNFNEMYIIQQLIDNNSLIIVLFEENPYKIENIAIFTFCDKNIELNRFNDSLTVIYKNSIYLYKKDEISDKFHLFYEEHNDYVIYMQYEGLFFIKINHEYMEYFQLNDRFMMKIQPMETLDNITLYTINFTSEKSNISLNLLIIPLNLNEICLMTKEIYISDPFLENMMIFPLFPKFPYIIGPLHLINTAISSNTPGFSIEILFQRKSTYELMNFLQNTLIFQFSYEINGFYSFHSDNLTESFAIALNVKNDENISFFQISCQYNPKSYSLRRSEFSCEKSENTRNFNVFNLSKEFDIRKTYITPDKTSFMLLYEKSSKSTYLAINEEILKNTSIPGNYSQFYIVNEKELNDEGNNYMILLDDEEGMMILVEFDINPAKLHSTFNNISKGFGKNYMNFVKFLVNEENFNDNNEKYVNILALDRNKTIWYFKYSITYNKASLLQTISSNACISSSSSENIEIFLISNKNILIFIKDIEIIEEYAYLTLKYYSVSFQYKRSYPIPKNLRYFDKMKVFLSKNDFLYIEFQDISSNLQNIYVYDALNPNTSNILVDCLLTSGIDITEEVKFEVALYHNLNRKDIIWVYYSNYSEIYYFDNLILLKIIENNLKNDIKPTFLPLNSRILAENDNISTNSGFYNISIDIALTNNQNITYLYRFNEFPKNSNISDIISFITTEKYIEVPYNEIFCPKDIEKGPIFLNQIINLTTNEIIDSKGGLVFDSLYPYYSLINFNEFKQIIYINDYFIGISTKNKVKFELFNGKLKKMSDSDFYIDGDIIDVLTPTNNSDVVFTIIVDNFNTSKLSLVTNFDSPIELTNLSNEYIVSYAEEIVKNEEYNLYFLMSKNDGLAYQHILYIYFYNMSDIYQETLNYKVIDLKIFACNINDNEDVFIRVLYNETYDDHWIFLWFGKNTYTLLVMITDENNEYSKQFAIFNYSFIENPIEIMDFKVFFKNDENSCVFLFFNTKHSNSYEFHLTIKHNNSLNIYNITTFKLQYIYNHFPGCTYSKKNFKIFKENDNLVLIRHCKNFDKEALFLYIRPYSPNSSSSSSIYLDIYGSSAFFSSDLDQSFINKFLVNQLKIFVFTQIQLIVFNISIESQCFNFMKYSSIDNIMLSAMNFYNSSYITIKNNTSINITNTAYQSKYIWIAIIAVCGVVFIFTIVLISYCVCQRRKLYKRKRRNELGFSDLIKK